MPEDKDYKQILSGTVAEAKDKIRELDSPDYRELLKLEKEGDDRETLKDFLNRKMSSLKNEDSEEEQESETEGSETENAEDKGFVQKLRALSLEQLLLLGGVSGLLLGLLIGYSLSPGAVQGQPGEAQSAVEQMIGAGNFNGTAEVGAPQQRHGMYFFNVTMTQQTPNGTQTGNQAVYVTKDAELMFPVVQSVLFRSPINIDEALAQQRQAQQQTQQEQ